MRAVLSTLLLVLVVGIGWLLDGVLDSHWEWPAAMTGCADGGSAWA